MRKLISYMVCLGIVLTFFSCIQEDLDKCFSGIRLKFHFDLHQDGMVGPIETVRVYLFDSDSVLYAVQEGEDDCLRPDFRMNLDVPPGKYIVVAFGCSGLDFYGSYNEGHVSDLQNMKYDEGVTVGKTTLAEFRVYLKCNVIGDVSELKIPAVSEFDDLYYGVSGKRIPNISGYEVQEVIVPEQMIVDQDIELLRNTNVLKVNVLGVENLHAGGVANVDVYALGTNECYTWNNRLSDVVGKIKYQPGNVTFKNDSLQMNIKMQRLEWETHIGMPVMLYLCDKNTGAKRYEMDIVKTLLQARDDKGNYIYTNQEDLDKIYNHEIDLKFEKSNGQLVVRVFIQGWEVKNVYPVM